MAGGSWKEWRVLHVLLFISFLVSGLVINSIQLVLFVTVAKIGGNRRLFRRLNYYLVYTIYAQLLFLADWWSGARVTYHCHQETLASLGKDHAIILMNHHYELDWLFGWMVGDRAGLLGNCRVYAKAMIQYVPVLGWAWTMSDTVFLERKWERDEAVLRAGLEELQDYPHPVWVLLFPEGTRKTEEKYQAGREFSESRGMPVLEHCLVPRTKGWSYTVAHTSAASIPWVYDVTIACPPSPPPTLTSALKGTPTTAHMYIRRFPLASIPRDEAGSAAWLKELFVAKDHLLDSFAKSGRFCVAGLEEFPGVEVARRPHSLVVAAVANLVVLVAGAAAAVAWLGALPAVLVVGGLGGLATLGINYFLGLTQVAKATEYGKKKE